MNRSSKPSHDTLKPASAERLHSQPLAKEISLIDRATALVDLTAVSQNAKYLRASAPQSQLLLAIKANAYGHGLIEIANAVSQEADYLAVARLYEAEALRTANINQPIVVLSDTLTQHNLNTYKTLNLTPCLFSDHNLKNQLSLLSDKNIDYWFKVNTGMNRLGVSIDFLKSNRNIFKANAFPQTIATHFVESEIEKSELNKKQITDFKLALDILESQHSLNRSRIKISLNNSAATINQLSSEFVEDSVNRCGIALYGAGHTDNPISNQLKPALSLWAPIIDIHHIKKGETVGYNRIWKAEKDSTIATIAIGYGDGYPRHAANGTPVLINNQRASLVGRVSMDMITVDISNVNQNKIEVGDTACLWGPKLSVETIAKHADSISYDLLTGLSERVVRIYRE